MGSRTARRGSGEERGFLKLKLKGEAAAAAENLDQQDQNENGVVRENPDVPATDDQRRQHDWPNEQDNRTDDNDVELVRHLAGCLAGRTAVGKVQILPAVENRRAQN